ncbi:MAG: ABC transporter ATP-binding protein/permease [Actinomycetota bacterium]|nr:ABC transporter ATP-binding protein/permease [Actinomycetota bacterium]
MFSGGWGWSYVRFDETGDQPKVDRALLGRVLRYGAPYKAKMAIILATIVVISVLALAPPLIMRSLIDDAIPDRDLRLVTFLGIAMVAIPLVTGVLGVLQRWASSAVGEGIIFDLRNQLYRHVLGMSLGFFTSTRTGELMSRLNNDVVGAQQAVTGTFITLAANIVAVVTTLVVMLGLEWRLTLLAMAIFPLFIVASRRVGRLLRVVRRDQLEHNATMNAHMQETLGVSGALLVKLFGRNHDEEQRFSGEAAAVRDLGVRQATIGRWFFMALGVMGALGSALVFWTGAVLVIEGAVSVGTIVALSAYLGNLYGPLTALSNARVEFATSLVSFERVFQVLDMEHAIDEIETPVRPVKFEGAIEFDGVWFRYGGTEGLETVRRTSSRSAFQLAEAIPSARGAEAWALQDVSFRVEPGELVALVGPSGAGKTTTTYLVPRLYDVDRGAVRIDGLDVRNLDRSHLADAIGVVTQEAYLFHDTIAVNLRYAKPDATDAELTTAAELANIATLIESLPDGYDTAVGERGYRLSGGEKQRIAIARVILRNPQILILDEATSHLDAHSEALIQDALERVMKGRTSLVIAHRLSTILSADRILVMEAGTVVESGSHAELLAESGLYASLYRTQFARAT